jgi:hypothetical protein
MQRDSRPTLDYSSPAEEHRREQAAETERREAIERYNESTFGEPRPIASAFLRRGVFIAVGVVLVFVLPRRAVRPVTLLLAIALMLWEWGIQGWTPPSWDSLRNRWRR